MTVIEVACTKALLTEVVFRSLEGYGIAMFTFLATLNSVINFVEILVKFPPVADFCISTAILLMNATQMNILDAIQVPNWETHSTQVW